MMTLKQQIEEVRAGTKKPTCFNDLLELQQKLDDLLAPRQKRERTISDICISAIAEIVEFNEETKESHKTWAKHEYNAEKEKEEAVDILFFALQLMNQRNIKSKLDMYISNVLMEIATNFERKHNEWERNYKPKRIVGTLIREFVFIFNIPIKENREIARMIDTIFLNLSDMYFALGMDFSEVLERYWSKWNENLNRIGKGKDGKGWL